MKIIKQETSAKGDEVFTIQLGSTELVALRDIFNYVYKRMVRSFFTMPFTSRVDAMRVEINKYIVKHKIGKNWKRPSHFMSDNVDEVF